MHGSGRREILGIDVGEAETEAFWTDFLRGLVARGLVGVQFAISDAHAGRKAAIAKVLGYASQRCAVHFLRDCLTVPATLHRANECSGRGSGQRHEREPSTSGVQGGCSGVGPTVWPGSW
jgi:transposase-like protein